MFNDYVHAALARERVSDLQATAQAARRARLTRTRRQPETPSVPRPRPAMEGTPTTLRDGSTVLIRQVRGTDAPMLADGFARLSARSRQAGIGRFTATVSADNMAMTGLLWKMGAKTAGRSRGTVEYEVTLEPADECGLDRWLRCMDDGSVLAWP